MAVYARRMTMKSLVRSLKRQDRMVRMWLPNKWRLDRTPIRGNKANMLFDRQLGSPHRTSQKDYRITRYLF